MLLVSMLIVSRVRWQTQMIQPIIADSSRRARRIAHQ